MQHRPNPPKHRRRRRPRARHLPLLLRKARPHSQLRRLRLPARPRRVAAEQRQPPLHPHRLPPPRRPRPLRRRQSTIRSRNNCAGFPAASSTAFSAASRNAPQSKRSIRAARYAPIWLTDGHANAREQAADRVSGPCRRRRPRSGRLSGPGFQVADRPGGAGRSRIEILGRGGDVLPPCLDRADRLVARDANIDYETKAPDPAACSPTMAGAKDVAARARFLRAANAGYLGAQGKARGNPRRKADGIKQPIPGGPVLKIGIRIDARAGTARETRR